MTERSLLLFRCFFCETGRVSIVPGAVAHCLGAGHGYLPVHERLDQRVFKFESAPGVAQPCPHLFLVSGSCARRKSQDRGAIAESMDFDWRHPRMNEIRGNDEAECAFWDGVILAPENAVRPDTKYVHDFFGRRWTQRGPGRRVRPFDVAGQFLFVEDVDAFLAQLPSFTAKFAEWLRQSPPPAGCLQ
jgi:hypothetical protein